MASRTPPNPVLSLPTIQAFTLKELIAWISNQPRVRLPHVGELGPMLFYLKRQEPEASWWPRVEGVLSAALIEALRRARAAVDSPSFPEASLHLGALLQAVLAVRMITPAARTALLVYLREGPQDGVPLSLVANIYRQCSIQAINQEVEAALKRTGP